MINDITDGAILANGVNMPWLGLGVLYIRDGESVENAVRWALEAGYRHIDTAAIYGNEAGVGRAIKQSGVPRADIFVTTKVWNRDQGYAQTLAAFESSLERLDMDYVDLYIIHRWDYHTPIERSASVIFWCTIWKVCWQRPGSSRWWIRLNFILICSNPTCRRSAESIKSN